MNIQELNDRFQQAPDKAAGRAVLAGCTTAELRTLAELNYVDVVTMLDWQLIEDIVSVQFDTQW